MIEYDLITDTWTQKTDIPSKLAGAAVASFNEKVYVSVGSPTYPPDIIKTVYEYEPGLDP